MISFLDALTVTVILAVIIFIIKSFYVQMNYNFRGKASALGSINTFHLGGGAVRSSYSYSFSVNGTEYRGIYVNSEFKKNDLKDKNHTGDQFIVFFVKDNPRFSKMKVDLFEGEPLNVFNLVQPPLGWQSIEEIPVPLKTNPYYVQKNKNFWSKFKEEYKKAKEVTN